MSSEDYSSEDEVFVGEQTMREVRKVLFRANSRQTIGYAYTNNNQEDSNRSVKIIETHSAPNLLPKIEYLPTITQSESNPDLIPENIFSDWDIKPDDTFLKLESMISDLNVTPQLQDSNIDSTSESKGYFFTGHSEAPGNINISVLHHENNSQSSDIKDSQHGSYDIKKEKGASFEKESQEDYNSSEAKMPFLTPVKNNVTPQIAPSPYTPTDVFKTPSNYFKRTPTFKTPGHPLSQKKSFTPSKKFQNVASPVAAYIKKCPIVPLVKDVCPRKPLPGLSSIPKLVKSKPMSTSKEDIKHEHKENMRPGRNYCISLPSVAYKSAKETELIKIPDNKKLPQNKWAREVASSIPRAMVIKHGYREVSSAKKPLQQQQEDSFADLSLHQADLSVCTEKSAFNN